MNVKKILIIAAMALMLFALVGCTANNERFISEAAGFWAGLWHGLICIIAFVISLFTDNVAIYEINNTGGWYDLGFVLGLMISIGQGGLWCPSKKKKEKSKEEREWEEIGKKVEVKVRTGIQNWLDETDADEKSPNEAEWEEIGKKVEEKIKRELRNWAEK